MTRKIHCFIIFCLANLAGMVPLSGQTVPRELKEAIACGDAGRMADFFHESLEMTILEKDHMASRDHAVRIMEGFFKENKPSGFTVSFEGTKEKSKYAIGSLATDKGTFRVNLFFMSRGDAHLIYYLSIEKESQYELHPQP
jgi:hypothetical protein